MLFEKSTAKSKRGFVQGNYCSRKKYKFQHKEILDIMCRVSCFVFVSVQYLQTNINVISY